MAGQWIQQPRSEWDAHGVVEEGKAKVLAHVLHRGYG
jgi:hypothetical protein